MTISRTVRVGGAAFVAGFVTALVAAIVVSKRKSSALRDVTPVAGDFEDMLGV
ncbi:MAG TPA: hypothetical protein VML00_07935 [Bacteroidota bacterium]|nr:hypothetical protein [Bacteroidota bacterium]